MNFDEAKKVFDEYVNSFNFSNNKIKLKYYHTLDVVKFSEEISIYLNLDEENIELAKIIGLLHDIGRFEQVKKYKSFSDSKTIDHAELGISILFDKGFIRKFISTDKYDNIIKMAILNHNKYQIQNGLNEIELLHSKIIRDADKTDIFCIRSKQTFKKILNIKEEKNMYDLNENMLDDFMNAKLILNTNAKTYLEKTILLIAYIFDFNFKYGLKFISDNNYINIILENEMKNNNKVKEIKRFALEYLNKKLKE